MGPEREACRGSEGIEGAWSGENSSGPGVGRQQATDPPAPVLGPGQVLAMSASPAAMLSASPASPQIGQMQMLAMQPEVKGLHLSAVCLQGDTPKTVHE